MWLKTYDTKTANRNGRVNLDHAVRIDIAEIIEDRYVVQAVMADGTTHNLSPQPHPTRADANAEAAAVLLRAG
ncbi:hypothetical protein QFZ56_003816 [Streptomyces achromogenes]|uniref:Uncharacterized protein n=1 Tax=Streptomyces achromogenes TaxID=67255 RepID=A0ABU0Q4X9_STRAH|nr:hypothetical protein [Streptomyces achromogenes]MDQ0684853.1 hypothetical protein [Streptomyces achromogenes]